ncbi:hypothetical protein [Cellulomonas sp. SLBN-39]|uniref:hypothetical protein n=1 Tax=Cellulomonas sp. SLBN-39 TaxID=2768446 RepID=UPI0011510A01|nr:hypothetical protein [Cellulomonas sp. SLBN-39]TQL03352.1 hypothetical protein FBY24_2450 [Cellulomonas sp. SLBN-39]
MSWHSDDPTGGAALRWEHVWADDDALAAELVDALADADLYERVSSSAHRAFTAHRGMLAARDDLAVDLMLLTLVHDSHLTGTSTAVRDRSGQPSRTLVFEGEGVGVEVEIDDDGVEGQLIPARPGQVTLRTPDGDVASVETDDVGYFRLDTRPEGPVRLVCTGASGTCVTTWLPW